MTERVRHVHLVTRDIGATVAWWRDLLGGVVGGEQLDPALADYALDAGWRGRPT